MERHLSGCAQRRDRRDSTAGEHDVRRLAPGTGVALAPWRC